MGSVFFQYAMARQRERDLEFELEQARLVRMARRLRPPLRHQLGAALVRLGTAVARTEPVQLRPRQEPCATA